MSTDGKSPKSELPPLQTVVAPSSSRRKSRDHRSQAATIKATSATLPQSKPMLSPSQMLAHAYGSWDNVPSTLPPTTPHPHRSRRVQAEANSYFAQRSEGSASSDGRTVTATSLQVAKHKDVGTTPLPHGSKSKGQVATSSHPTTPKCSDADQVVKVKEKSPKPPQPPAKSKPPSTKPKSSSSSKSNKDPPHLRWVPGQKSRHIRDPDYPILKQISSPPRSPTPGTPDPPPKAVADSSNHLAPNEERSLIAGTSLQPQNEDEHKMSRPLALAELDCFSQAFQSVESIWGNQTDYQPSRICDTPHSGTPNVSSGGSGSAKSSSEYMSTCSGDLVRYGAVAKLGATGTVAKIVGYIHPVHDDNFPTALRTAPSASNNLLSPYKASLNSSRVTLSTPSASPRSSLYESAVESLSDHK